VVVNKLMESCKIVLPCRHLGGYSSWVFVFDPKSVHVGFLVGKAALFVIGLPSGTSVTPHPSVIPTMNHNHAFVLFVYVFIH
jgi:hypothetical protein